MGNLIIETEVNNEDRMKEIISALKKINNLYAVIKIKTEDIFDILNEYMIQSLDIDLKSYDNILIIQNNSSIILDMELLKDESYMEYEYIINEMKKHFGKSIIKKIKNEDDRILDILNIRSALRTIFNDSYDIIIENDYISIKMEFNIIENNHMFKYSSSL